MLSPPPLQSHSRHAGPACPAPHSGKQPVLFPVCLRFTACVPRTVLIWGIKPVWSEEQLQFWNTLKEMKLTCKCSLCTWQRCWGTEKGQSQPLPSRTAEGQPCGTPKWLMGTSAPVSVTHPGGSWEASGSQPWLNVTITWEAPQMVLSDRCAGYPDMGHESDVQPGWRASALDWQLTNSCPADAEFSNRFSNCQGCWTGPRISRNR